MAMDPNSPSYIKEEMYPYGSKFIQEKINFESYLSRGITDNSVTENVPSLGIGRWIYSIKDSLSGQTGAFDESNLVNRQQLYTFSPSSDPEATLALNFKVPPATSPYITLMDLNHTLDLTFLPSINNVGTIKTESVSDTSFYLTDGGGGNSSSNKYANASYVLDFWFKVPTFNTSIFYMCGWATAYIYQSDLSNPTYYNLEPTLFQIGITDYLDGTKRLICHVAKELKGYINDQNMVDWENSLSEKLVFKDLIFFIDNNINLDLGSWHHLVIKMINFVPAGYFSITDPTPSIRIWFDDDKVFTANNIYFHHYGSTKEVFDLRNDINNINTGNSNVGFRFAISNRLTGEDIGSKASSDWWKINIADLNSYIVQTHYRFNAFYFPDLANTNNIYNSPNATLNYYDLFDDTVSSNEALYLKDLKYSTVSLTQVSNQNFYKDIINPITIDIGQDISEDLIPISIDAAKDINPVDIPIAIDVPDYISEDLISIIIDAAKDISPVDIPTTIDIKEDIVKDLLNPIEVTIGKDITPVDPFEITLEATNPFKPIEEIEEYINKTYLGTQQAAEDFQLLYKVTEYSYWPVDFSIDNNYHIHIKKSEVYLGATLYACTNKQFLYGKYVI